MARAALASLLPHRAQAAPEVVLRSGAVRASRVDVSAYAHVCGFRVSDALPITYPHVLGFPLAMRLMTRRDFPFRPAGLVHVRNVIRQHRTLALDEPLDLAVWAEGPYEHAKGRTVELTTETRSGGELVWLERSTYLRRDRATATPSNPSPPSIKEEAGTVRALDARNFLDRPVQEAPWIAGAVEFARWSVPADQGRRYARVSDDYNPIHLSGLTARMFGFRSAVAHGMWTKARALAELQDRLPDSFEVGVDFVAPLPLPATVELRAAADAQRFEVVLVDDGARPHLIGVVAV